MLFLLRTLINYINYLKSVWDNFLIDVDCDDENDISPPIENNLFDKAIKFREEFSSISDDLEDFKNKIDNKNHNSM